MRTSAIARRYAEAAYQVAQQHHVEDEWQTQLQTVLQVLADQRMSDYFRDPNVSRQDKLSTIDQSFAGMQPQVKNLLKLLASSHRIGLLPQVVQEFASLNRQARGIVEAQITVARPLAEQEQQDIGRQLARSTGKQVELTTQVDPELIGGIVVRIGDRVIDASVSGRLQRLRQQLAL